MQQNEVPRVFFVKKNSPHNLTVVFSERTKIKWKLSSTCGFTELFSTYEPLLKWCQCDFWKLFFGNSHLKYVGCSNYEFSTDLWHVLLVQWNHFFNYFLYIIFFISWHQIVSIYIIIKRIQETLLSVVTA